MTGDQHGFSIRCEWGEQGIVRLAPVSDVVIVVDVLSFSTCVSAACTRGATVFPYRWKDDSALAFARSQGAALAGPRETGGFSLSPVSLAALAPGTRLVLPSPNGATLALAAGKVPTLAGCLRNAAAVAQAAVRLGRTFAVIPAGERWPSDGSLRPAAEDLIGAGAIIRHRPGTLSPEAGLALAAFHASQADLNAVLRDCVSGQELVDRGFDEDIGFSARLDVDDGAPLLRDGAFQAFRQTGATPAASPS